MLYINRSQTLNLIPNQTLCNRNLLKNARVNLHANAPMCSRSCTLQQNIILFTSSETIKPLTIKNWFRELYLKKHRERMALGTWGTPNTHRICLGFNMTSILELQLHHPTTIIIWLPKLTVNDKLKNDWILICSFF